jgi:TolA-binding protein
VDDLFNSANQLQREGKYQEAIEVYKHLTKKFPDSKFAPQAQFMIGFIYANELKDFDKAKDAYQEFLKKFPDHEMAKDAKWEMDHLGKDINDIEDLTETSPEVSNK